MCFELAVTKGAPADEDHEAADDGAARTFTTDRDRTAIEVLNRFVE